MPARLAAYLIATSIIVGGFGIWHTWRVRSKVAEVHADYAVILADIAANRVFVQGL